MASSNIRLIQEVVFKFRYNMPTKQMFIFTVYSNIHNGTCMEFRYIAAVPEL